MVFSYRAFFGGAYAGGCLFCPERRAELKDIIHEDEQVLIIRNRALAGTDHWLIIPKRHIRDVERCTDADVPLLQAMERALKSRLREKYPHIAPSDIYAGYHRGHRPLGGWFKTFGSPDIISVHHLHLHVIIRPCWYSRWLKYPFWFPLMWISAESVRAKWNLETSSISN
ncbi:hypothetical protein PVAG01_11128 [Phlyctema vagabunda]|uniref:HIT domain-containing protein n=1 Tax=Phlyctema vagabunda TaxID=108571 RepID=A0ABR4P1F9_9HELO